jgi:hypothetical protein
MCRGVLLFAASLALLPSRAAAQASDLRTVAEQSGYTRTGRYDEVERLCAAFAARWPSQVRCTEFGRSPEGRRMLALIASADGTVTPAEARRKRRPVLLMQGGIHAGEIDGKDAGFAVLRDVLQGTVARGALARVTVVFVPVFNVDGHERVNRHNRPNQVGPEEMGWRATAQNLNLNRDYVKAEAPEMRAMLRLLGEWDPIVYADLHVTDGGDFEHDISLNVAPTHAGHDALRQAAVSVRDGLMKTLTAQGSLPLDFYPSFVTADDPASGFAVDIGPPRFSHEYWAMRQRIGVLVETHSWKPYAVRVGATRNTIVGLLEQAATDGTRWLDAAAAADRQSAALAGTTIALTYAPTAHTRTLAFRGYAYTRERSPISGGLVTRYDPKTPQIWRVPLRDELAPAATADAPRGGYIVPAGYAAAVAETLAVHGIEHRTLAAPKPRLAVRTFRATRVTLGRATFEGRTTATLEGAWRDEARDVPAGSLFVPIAQPKAYLVMALFEPVAPDSLVAWGFFNAAFEPKEYMEAYVTEAAAAEMLAKDPELKREFERRVAEDAAFAGDPRARLDFFYRRHPAFDERFNLYPVYRTDAAVP